MPSRQACSRILLIHMCCLKWLHFLSSISCVMVGRRMKMAFSPFKLQPGWSTRSYTETRRVHIPVKSQSKHLHGKDCKPTHASFLLKHQLRSQFPHHPHFFATEACLTIRERSNLAGVTYTQTQDNERQKPDRRQKSIFREQDDVTEISDIFLWLPPNLSPDTEAILFRGC